MGCPVSIIILTKDEEGNLADRLKSSVHLGLLRSGLQA